MTLDIRGALKNTKRSKSLFIVFDELLSNAIDSYLILRDKGSISENLNVCFNLEFFDAELEGEVFDLRISCTDNGAGFGDAETKAFVTKDTSFKDDLDVEGIGRCKGTGRVQYFHFFKKLKIRSRYDKDGSVYERRLDSDPETKELDEHHFQISKAASKSIGTEIILDGIQDKLLGRLAPNSNIMEELSAVGLKRHFLATFLHRLVAFKGQFADFSISIQTNYKQLDPSVEKIDGSDLPPLARSFTIDVPYRSLKATVPTRKEQFKISHYKIDQYEYDLPRNIVALSAKSSPVEMIVRRYLKNARLENNPIDGFYHFIFVESDYLEKHVNDQRDGFWIAERSEGSGLLWDDELTREEIFDALDPAIIKLVTPPNWSKEKVVSDVAEAYGITQAMIADTSVRINFGDTDEAVARRVLASYQERIIDDTSEIFELKKRVSELSPDDPAFRDQINKLAWKYTASIKSIDMANLSQLVVRRAAIVEVLQLAVKKDLAVQKNVVGKRKDERLIHSIFFPMGKDSLTTDDHDIWLLSEEYQYFDYVSSDKALSTMKWGAGEPLFDDDVDEELERIFDANTEENKGKRPDIAIFSEEGSVIIIEFKAPGVSLDDHVNDLMEYSQLLAAKSKGRLRQFYGYLIGTKVNSNRLRGYKRFPNGRGWFSTEGLVEQETGKPLGELYSEILFYDDIVHKAASRLQVYRERLSLDLNNA